jgi:tetratricopeptide (TPR) repeat protein
MRQRFTRSLLVSTFFLLWSGLTGAQQIQSFAVRDQSVRDVLQGRLNRPRADTFYLLALSNANKGNTPEARRNLGIGLNIEPRNVQLLNLKAAMLAREGKTDEAVRVFQTVLDIAPENEYARASLRWLDVPKPAPPPKVNPQAAREIVPTKPMAIKESAPDSAGGAGSAEKSYSKGFFADLQEKQRCFHALNAIKRAQDNLAASQPDKKGTLDLGLLVSEKLLPASPICPRSGTYSWTESGPECSKHGSFDQLEPEIKTVFADFNEGMRAKFLRNYPDARGFFTKVVSLYPNWAEAHYQLADSCFRQGKDKEAISSLNHCLKLEGTHLDAQLMLANLQFKTGNKNGALKTLEIVLKRAPDSIHSLSARSLSAAIKSGKNYYSIFPPE